MIPAEKEFVQDGLRFAGWLEPQTARLAIHIPSGRVVAGGTLLIDYKGRWEDGTSIRTSYIQEVLYVEEQNLTVINTRNSVYFVKKNLLSDYGIGNLTNINGKALEEMSEAGEIELGGAY